MLSLSKLFGSLLSRGGFSKKARAARQTKRRLGLERLEDRSLLALDSFIVSHAVPSDTAQDGDTVLLADLAFATDPDVFITDVTFPSEGNYAPSVFMDYFKANGQRGRDGIYETPFRGPLSLEGGVLTIGLHPHGIGLPQGLFARVFGTIDGGDQTVGLGTPDMNVFGYEFGAVSGARPADVHVIGADLPTYQVQGEVHADLIGAISGPDQVEEGGILTLTTTGANFGPVNVENVVLTVAVPTGLTFNAVASPGWTLHGNEVSLTRSLLEVGQSVTETVSFTVGVSAPASIVTHLHVTGDLIDPFPANNFDSQETQVVAAPGPELFVTVKSIGTSDVAVENQRDIPLIRLDVYAEGGDIALNGTSFDADQGSVLNVVSYTLWADTDGNGEVETIVAPGSSVGGVVTFDSNPVIVPQGEVMVLEVHGDVASSLTSDTLQLGLRSVAAEDLSDGSDLGPDDITIADTASIVWTFVENGNLEVLPDTTPLQFQHLLGGTGNTVAFVASFLANVEPIDVYRISVAVRGDAGSIERIHIRERGNPTILAIATVGGSGSIPFPPGTTLFTTNLQSRQLVVAEGMQRTLEFLPLIKPDFADGRSGDEFTVGFEVFAGAISARGDVSTNDLGANVLTTSFYGPSETVVMAEVARVENNNPDVFGTAPPIGVSTVGRVRMTGASQSNTKDGLNDVLGDVASFVFDASNILVNAEGFRLFNTADATVQVAGVVTTLDGSTILTGNVTGMIRVTYRDLVQHPIDTEIDQGAFLTLSVQIDIRNPQIDATEAARLRVFMDTEAFEWLDSDVSTSNRFTGIDGIYDDVLIGDYF